MLETVDCDKDFNNFLTTQIVNKIKRIANKILINFDFIYVIINLIRSFVNSQFNAISPSFNFHNTIPYSM